MSALAVGLVPAAAVCHAVWNLLLKRAGDGLGGTLVFVWLSSAARPRSGRRSPISVVYPLARGTGPIR
jgi:hypothetical protein